MQKEILLNILAQNQTTCMFAFNQLTSENANFRLNEAAASAGFIYRHVGETINLFGTFFGVPTDVQNTTMGKTDEGQEQNIEEGKFLIEKGYGMLQNLVENMPDTEWLEMIDTPFFGKVPKIRLFTHILFHNAHHAGQLSLIFSKGKRY